MFCTDCGFKNHDHAKFCSSCGVRQQLSPPQSIPDQVTPNKSDDTFVEYAKNISLTLNGSLASQVESKFCDIVNVKKFDKVLSSILVGQDIILIVPAAKNRHGFTIAGILLSGGSGLISILGMTAGTAIGQLFINNQSNSVNALRKQLEDTLIINASTIRLKAYDYRSMWDFGGGEWETRISIEGEALFNGYKGNCEIRFSAEGKTYERTFLCKANNKVPELAKLLKIPTPEIKKETKFIW
jgi:hypothetical protein